MRIHRLSVFISGMRGKINKWHAEERRYPHSKRVVPKPNPGPPRPPFPKPPPRPPSPSPKQRCPRAAWALADAYWQLLSFAERWRWRKAVKMSGISGYDLFMKENMYCFLKGEQGTELPSISGGYSTHHVFCGNAAWQPPEECKKPPEPPPWVNPVGDSCFMCYFDTPKYYTVFIEDCGRTNWPGIGSHVLVQDETFACRWSLFTEDWTFHYHTYFAYNELFFFSVEASYWYRVHPPPPAPPRDCQNDQAMYLWDYDDPENDNRPQTPIYMKAGYELEE